MKSYFFRFSKILLFGAGIIIFGLLILFSRDYRFVDLWLTHDQQGQYYFEHSDYEKAAALFDNPMRKGVSHYLSGDFEEAAGLFAPIDSPEGYFNLGNTLTRLGNYDAAVIAYQKVLEIRPEFEDAVFNMDLVLSLITKEKDDEPEEQGASDPSFDPDEVQFDEKGKKGKKGEIDLVELTDDQMAEMLLKQVQPSPAQFLKSKFSFQWHSKKNNEK